MGCVAVVEWRLGCVLMVAHITVLVVLAKSRRADHRNLAGPQRARYLMGIRDWDRDDLSVGDRTFWRGLWRECLWECDWGGSGGWGLGGLGGVTQSTVSAAADTKTTARVRTLMNMAWVVLAARDPGVAVSRSVVVAVGALATVPLPRRLLLLSAIRKD